MDVEDTENEEEQIGAVAKGAVDSGVNPAKVQEIFTKLLEISARPPKPGRRPARTVFDTKTHIQDVLNRIDEARKKNSDEGDLGIPDSPKPTEPPPSWSPEIEAKFRESANRPTSGPLAKRPEIDTSIFNDKDNEIDSSGPSATKNLPDKSGIDKLIEALKDSANSSLNSIEKIKNSPNGNGIGGVAAGTSGSSGGGFPGLLSGVSIFDKPIPVIVVGPKPLQVTGIGGSGSGGSRTPRTPKPKPKKLSGWRRALNHFGKGRAGRTVKAAQATGETAGEMIGGAGSRAAAGLGAAGATVGVIIAAGAAAYSFERSIASASDEALRSAAKYKEMNADIANIFGQKELADLMRDMRHAQATSTSAEGLQGSDSKRKDAEDRISIVFQNGVNTVLMVLNETLAPVIERVAGWVEAIGKWLNLDVAKKEELSGLGATAADMMLIQRDWDLKNHNLMDIARKSADKVKGGAVAPGGFNPAGRGPV